MNKRLSLLIAAALLASPIGVAQASEPGLVRTDAGPVRGTVLADHQLYQGIPYAAPPVGELRWRSPQPVTPWTTPRDATKPGPACAQADGAGSPSTTEDCLYLNVTTPSRHGRKPVMVYLHGGGNSYLSGAGFGTNRLAVQGDVVVVTLNFRLGFFGFFGHFTFLGKANEILGIDNPGETVFFGQFFKPKPPANRIQVGFYLTG